MKNPDGNGYLVSGTLEQVKEEDLINAAKSYLANDGDFNDRVQDTLFFELDSLLEQEDGSKRNMDS